MATTTAPDALYAIFSQVKPYFKSVKMGGVVGDAAHGSGYHLSRNALKARGLTGDYSIQCPADKDGSGSYAAAIDLTFGQLAELVTVTKRLRAACTPNAKGDYDPRIEPLREHIGTLDGKNVCGYNRVATGSGSRSRVGWVSSGFSDSSHLWHAHLSILRRYVTDKNAMTGIAEVVAGLPAGKLGWRDPDASSAPVVPKPAPKPATTDTTPEVPKPMFEKVIELDAPGAGNWQGAAQNVKTGEWFIAHSRGRTDGAEDVVLYRFDKAGKYQDKMTLEKCTHIYGFGVSDTNVIWLTWNDDTNDVVTLQYEAGKTVRKSAASPMHVFSDGWVDVSFSPSRDWVAHRQRNYPSKGFETYRRYRKQNILDGVDDKSGVDVVIPTSSSRVVQGFSLVNSNLYVLIGLAPNSSFRIEKWDFKTGKKVGELKLDPRLGLRDGETDKVEPEGMDGRTFGMKVGTDDARRLIVYKLTGF